MKLCMSCLEELFDKDTFCPKCNNKNLICNKELQQIKLELKNVNQRKKNKLLLNPKYACVDMYINIKQKRDAYPEIIKIYETHNKINDHFLNRKAKTHQAHPHPSVALNAVHIQLQQRIGDIVYSLDL